ncbi:MAG: hemerythrin domain-containing protein [Candidatus Melainabacteria bacterium]|nr:hemerythrin domain-containing protein [Candidatus Melainabacteria bacterium]
MTLKEKSAVEVLKSSHKRINELLDSYNEKLSSTDKEKVLADVSFELSVLSVLETEVFYPAITEANSASSMDEYIESHDKIKIAMAQTQRMMGDEPDFDPHMKELCKLMKSHIDKEEKDLFPSLKDSSVDLEAVGHGMFQKREEFDLNSGKGKSPDLGLTI